MQFMLCKLCWSLLQIFGDTHTHVTRHIRSHETLRTAGTSFLDHDLNKTCHTDQPEWFRVFADIGRHR